MCVTAITGYCLDKMDEEAGLESRDTTSGKLGRDVETSYLTFTNVQDGYTLADTPILDRDFGKIIDVRAIALTLQTPMSSPASGQVEGTTTPKEGVTQSQRISITFTVQTKKQGQDTFTQVVIGNDTREVSKL